MQTKRLVSQITFLTIFLVLMFTNKAQIWMFFLFLSIALAAFFGRYYCGWICPINTTLRVGNFFGRILGTQKKGVPKFFKSKGLRVTIFVIFSGALAYTIYTMMTGQKFPLPIIIIGLGIIFTIFINENTWHRYLCPWGILLSFTAKFSKRGLSVSRNSCISCSKCYNNCPAEAINFDNKAEIDKRYCLLCYKCQESCPVDIIDYKKENNEREKSERVGS